MTKYFGTDGFRGEANVQLTPKQAYKIGRFLGAYQGEKRKAKIVIGKDTRKSGDMLEAALVSGITASGADVYLLQVATTPCVSYIARIEGFDFGIMISASHNPFYDNGIKIFDSQGRKLEGEILNSIEIYMDEEKESIHFAQREQIGRSIPFQDAKNKYSAYLTSICTNSFKNVKVGIDCANGSASSIAKSIFEGVGAQTFVIHNEPNGLNINTNCGSTHIRALQQYVMDNELDVGFSYDGDADRCIAVDEKGRIIDGDLILYICGCHMKEHGELTNNTIVTTIMSNLGLYLALDKAGIYYEKTDVGDKYVYDNMIKNGHSIGGEQSGHIIFSNHAVTGDGILTSLKIMEVMMEKKMKLSSLMKEIELFPQLLINVEVLDKEKVQSDEDVKKVVKLTSDILGKEGRVLLRKSGTESVIRIMIEAKTEALCKKYAYEIVEILRKKGHAKDR